MALRHYKTILSLLYFLLSFFLGQFVQAQHSGAKGDSSYILHLSNIPVGGITLDTGWKFHSGDKFQWTNPDFDDRQWQDINPTQDIYDLHELKKSGIGWFRLHLQIDSTMLKESLTLMIEQTGASEVYLNGNRIYTMGKVSSYQKEIITYNPLSDPVSLQFDKEPSQVLAIRYAYKKNMPYFIFAGRPNHCFAATINKTNQAINNIASSAPSYVPDIFRAGLFFILSILHFALYVFYPKKSSNLFFSLFATTAVVTNIMYICAISRHNTESRMYLLWITIILFNLYNLLFLKALHIIVKNKKKIVFQILLACFLLSIPLYFWPYHFGWIFGFAILPNAALLECVRISFMAMKQKQKGAIILVIGAICFLIFYLSFYMLDYFIPPRHLTDAFYHLTYNTAVISLPISTSIFLALEFAFTNRSLEAQLAEVQKLSEQTVAQEQEKQQILANQNEMLEREVTERTAELTQQKTEAQKTLEDLKSTQDQLIQSEKEQMRTYHGKEVLELEAKALRAQMNPHFIFNCMNSIKSLIQKNEEDKAVTYLTTFSKLIRTIFQNSDKREVSLHDEIETCKLYIQLESMRFGNKFNYHFNVNKILDLKSVQVPALIIQPFIENAIWHGIMPKEDGGTVTISVEQRESNICCTIDDDGIGRELSKQNKFKGEPSTHQSRGIHLTQSRLDLDNVLNKRNATLETIDKKDEEGKSSGTIVVLTFKEY